MPTSPFAEEHESLGATVRRLVAERFGSLAAAAEAGERVHAGAVELTADLRGMSGDVLAEVVVAQELGRIRSAGLVAVLLDAALLHDLGAGTAAGAVARSGDVQVSEDTADGSLPMVVGAASAQQIVVLHAGVAITLNEGSDVHPVAALHGLRGAAVADVVLRSAPCRALEVPPTALHLAELREAAALVGGAWQTFDDAHAYAGQRTAFGRPIGAFQVNRHGIAELATWLTAAEALVHDTAWTMSRGSVADTAMARLFAGRTARRVAEACLQLHGGYGYTMDFDVQRAWRDARASAIGDDDRRARTLTGQGAMG